MDAKIGPTRPTRHPKRNTDSITSMLLDCEIDVGGLSLQSAKSLLVAELSDSIEPCSKTLPPLATAATLLRVDRY